MRASGTRGGCTGPAGTSTWTAASTMVRGCLPAMLAVSARSLLGGPNLAPPPRPTRSSGQWVNGKMHGKGVYTFPNGNKYDGEWVEDVKEGFGTLTVRRAGLSRAQTPLRNVHGRPPPGPPLARRST